MAAPKHLRRTGGRTRAMKLARERVKQWAKYAAMALPAFAVGVLSCFLQGKTVGAVLLGGGFVVLLGIALLPVVGRFIHWWERGRWVGTEGEARRTRIEEQIPAARTPTKPRCTPSPRPKTAGVKPQIDFPLDDNASWLPPQDSDRNYFRTRSSSQLTPADLYGPTASETAPPPETPPTATPVSSAPPPPKQLYYDFSSSFSRPAPEVPTDRMEKMEKMEKIKGIKETEETGAIEVPEKMEAAEAIKAIEAIEKMEAAEKIKAVASVEAIETIEEMEVPQKIEKIEEIEEIEETGAVEAPTPVDKGRTYQCPPFTLLRAGTSPDVRETAEELRARAQRLAETLLSFGVEAVPGEAVQGPAVTRYAFFLAQGVKLSKVTNLAGDIALSLGVNGVRIAPIPDKIAAVGIEVPNKTVTPVSLRDVLSAPAFVAHPSPVAFAVGRDIGNQDVIGDVAQLPHVLIAGTTGSGKSVCTNALIVSILCKSSPEEVRFLMIDPKMVELAPYNDIPHLLAPVVTNPKKAAGALQWAVGEMMARYTAFSKQGAKKLSEYNAAARQDGNRPLLPSIVVVIDELADLMMAAAKEVEESICRIAQMGRAAGIHLVIATQRPSADVITGLMKANIPSRIAFAVASALESRIILDSAGAEKLAGRGDMLYAPLGSAKPQRVQGCYVAPEEIDAVVKFVKSQGEAQYSGAVAEAIETSVPEADPGKKGGHSSNAAPAAEDDDALLTAAVEVFLDTGQASVSMLQRRLKLGYARAARLVDEMEARGYIGPPEGSKPRQILITRAEWAEWNEKTDRTEKEQDHAAENH